MERRQSWRRRMDAGGHELINELAHASVEELGDKPSHVLADRLRIYRRDAARRMEEAADLGSRCLTPEARAGWDAVQAKLAAPGMCNPADETPTVSRTPSQEAIKCDARSTAQRNHDVFNAGSQIWHC